MKNIKFATSSWYKILRHEIDYMIVASLDFCDFHEDHQNLQQVFASNCSHNLPTVISHNCRTFEKFDIKVFHWKLEFSSFIYSGHSYGVYFKYKLVNDIFDWREDGF